MNTEAKERFPMGMLVLYHPDPKIVFRVTGYCGCSSTFCALIKLNELVSGKYYEHNATDLVKYTKPLCSQCR